MISIVDLADVGEVNYTVDGDAGGVQWITITDRVHFENVRRKDKNLAYRDRLAYALAKDCADEINNAQAGSYLIANSDAGADTPKATLEKMLAVVHNADGTLKSGVSGGAGGVMTLPIINDHTSQIDTDSCIHIYNWDGTQFQVKLCDPTDSSVATCSGFPTSTISAGGTGTLQVGPYLTGIGSVDYPFRQLVVGTDGKPAWIDGTGAPTANYPTIGTGATWLCVLGEGRGEGKLQMAFSAVVNQV
jgi:hypothetical protein